MDCKGTIPLQLALLDLSHERPCLCAPMLEHGAFASIGRSRGSRKPIVPHTLDLDQGDAQAGA
jgi:hypothetical protein